MFEVLVVFAAALLGLAAVGVVIKILLAILLLPLKVGLFLIGGVLAAFCVVPAAVVSIGVLSIVPLVLLSILGFPLVIVVGGIILLVKFLR